MAWENDLEIVVARTGVENYRHLCSTAYHDHVRMRAQITKMAAQPDMPPAHTQIKNALSAAGRVIGAVVTGQPILVSREVLAERQETCKACENFVGGRCRLCGCYLSQKIRLATESCPMNPPRWTAIEQDK